MFKVYMFAFLSVFATSATLADVYDTEWENVENKNGSDEFDDRMVAEVDEQKLATAQSAEAETLRIASSKHVRRFHEVLDELLAEFGYDVRMGQLKGLKNLSIRKVDVSDALPSTYQNYTELLVAERIRENSRVRLVTCNPCKTKTSRLVEGKLLITSPTTNTLQMQRAADQLGIDNFMDVVLVYHSTHMVLAMQIFKTDTQDLVWARTYNSETIKSRYQKLAIDYKQVEKSRPGEDYVPEYRFLVGGGGAIVPNINAGNDDTGMAVLMVRGTEKFNNRKQEFGLHMTGFIAKTSVTGRTEDEDASDEDEDTADQSSLEPWTFAVAMYGLFAHNFVGNLESYNKVRHSVNLGVGFIMAPTSYLAGSARLGWDIYFGRRFAANFGAYYFAPTKVVSNDESIDIEGGAGGEIGMSINI